MSDESDSNVALQQEKEEVAAEQDDDEDGEEDEESRNLKEQMGLTEVESLCMNCMENGMTRFMIHKIPYFRELVIASFECEHCGERNNEVTFGGEIQVQGCAYQLEVTCERDLNRQIIKSDSATVTFPSLEFEIPANTQKGEISTIEGFISTGTMPAFIIITF
jgi:zinc finger protein